MEFYTGLGREGWKNRARIVTDGKNVIKKYGSVGARERLYNEAVNDGVITNYSVEPGTKFNYLLVFS